MSDQANILEVMGIIDGINDPIVTDVEAHQVLSPVWPQHARWTEIG